MKHKKILKPTKKPTTKSVKKTVKKVKKVVKNTKSKSIKSKVLISKKSKLLKKDAAIDIVEIETDDEVEVVPEVHVVAAVVKPFKKPHNDIDKILDELEEERGSMDEY